MKNHPHMRYTQIKTRDGVHVPFPVSKHVLRVRNAVAEPKKESRWQLALMQKSIAFGLVLSLAASSMGITYAKSVDTLSYFRDVESSTNNIFLAALLDFLVADASYSRTITSTTTPLIIPITTPESGSLQILYKVTAEQTAGVNAFCNTLNLTATSSPFIYSGSLLGLNTTATTTTGIWKIGLTMATSTGITNGDQCEVDLIYRGWHPTMPEYTGFTDEEKVHLIITYAAFANDFDVVLNEFLPNPDISANGLNLGTDSSSKPLGEWIELYNKGAAPVDVLDWYMTDASGGAGNTHAVIGPANTNTGSTIIPPGGWLVVYTNKATLNNTGDEIHLYTDDDVEVDFTTYEDPSNACVLPITPGGENSTSTPTGTPGNGPGADCVQNQVAPNKTYARVPDGTGPWIDPIPTPGYINTAENFPESTESSSGGGSTAVPPNEPAPTPESSLAEETPDEIPPADNALEETAPSETVQEAPPEESTPPSEETTPPVEEETADTPPPPPPSEPPPSVEEVISEPEPVTPPPESSPPAPETPPTE
jgi:hypothetical protein